MRIYQNTALPGHVMVKNVSSFLFVFVQKYWAIILKPGKDVLTEVFVRFLMRIRESEIVKSTVYKEVVVQESSGKF